MSGHTNSGDTRALLVVEPDEDLRRAITEHLELDERYGVTAVDSAQDAMDALGRRQIDLMVLAMTLPDGGALEIVPRALEHDRHLPIIVLTELSDVGAAGQCVQKGAYLYLTRPVDPSEFSAAVEQGLKRRSEFEPDAEASQSGSDAVREEVSYTRRELEQVINGTLEVVMSLVESKDPALMGHSQRVAALAATVADEMGLSDEDVEEVRLAGRFHDLGKIGIPDELLNKRESPTEEELRLVRRHAVMGEEILAEIKHLGNVPAYVRSHHEHWDGSGYPDGLAGEKIPIGARILCAVEMFDALTTPGANREALDPVSAVRRMMAVDGTIVDPAVLVAFADVVASQRNLPFLVEAEQRLNASGIVMIQ